VSDKDFELELKSELLKLLPNIERMNKKNIDIKIEFEKLLRKETDNNKRDILASLLVGNYQHIFEDYANSFIEDADNAVINAHYVYDYCADITLGFYISIINEYFIDESFKENFQYFTNNLYKKNIELDNEFRKTVSKFDHDNIPIKIFPANTTNQEKEILNYLAKNYFIRRDLSQNKLPRFMKNGTKRLIKALYEYAPDYMDFQAFNFINSYIETNLPIATLQNYCREVKKDISI
jgi:hypothetical protein